jgi:3-oxoacyl-[acyl-carrier protein] reductase
VATFSRSPSPFIEEAQQSIGQDRFYWAPVNGRDVAALQRFVTAVDERFGGIDALINNAAIGRFGTFPLMRLAEIDDSIAVNLQSNIVLTRLVAPSLVARGGGAIVNISSVNALRGNSGVAVYSATLAPGYFESDMVADLNEAQMRRIVRSTPLGRLGTISEIAAAVLFLISPAASFITGHTLVIDGGITC